MSVAPAATGVRPRARSLRSIACSLLALLCAMAAVAGAASAPATASAPRDLGTAITTDIWHLAAAPASAAPAPAAGVTSMFQATDNTGASMDGLDIIVNPVDPRTYLGTYHVNLGPGRFALRLAASKDLRTWRMIADLDAAGGGMGTLRALPGGGFLLAYEAQEPTRSDGKVDSSVRLRYYRDPVSLIRGTPTEERTLPRRLSTTNEGTPDFRAIAWRGSLATSVIKLGFHYLDHGKSTARRTLPVDREARGTLAANRWSAVPDTSVDRALTRMGFKGNHGGRRQFAVPGGHSWRVYEAQRYVNVTSSWRLLLYDVTARTWNVLRVKTPGGSTAFANPTVSLLPSPRSASASAVVMTTFVPTAGAGAGESGEAISYLDL
ncbi:MAG: hypothetical protein QOJ46_2762 [bacterium]